MGQINNLIRSITVDSNDLAEIKKTRGYSTQLNEVRSNGTVKNHNDLICGTGIEYKMMKLLDSSDLFSCDYFDKQYGKDIPDNMLLWDRNFSINGKIVNEDIINLSGRVVDIKTQSYVTTIKINCEIKGINTKKDILPEDYEQFFIVDMNIEQIKKSRASFYVFYYHKQKKINDENVYDYDYIGYLTKEQVLSNFVIGEKIVDNLLQGTYKTVSGCWIKKSDIKKLYNWIKD